MKTNQKGTMRYCIIFILLGVIFSGSCVGGKKNFQNRESKNCSDSSLSLIVSKIEALSIDSIMIDLVIENHCTDSVIIMNDYTKPIFYFPGGNIRPHPVQTMPLYPSIDWETSSKGVKEIHIRNRCRPLINSYNIIVIAPNESKKITLNVRSLGYHGFSRNVQYDFSVSFDVSNQIKSYCPFVWSGFTKSPTYSFTIK